MYLNVLKCTNQIFLEMKEVRMTETNLKIGLCAKLFVFPPKRENMQTFEKSLI